MRSLIISSVLVTLTSASFCGDSSVPFSLEILPDGQPVLGCSRPSCFGWAPSGKPASSSGTFYTINNHPDGFMRQERQSIPAYGPNDPRYDRPNTAVCDESFSSSSCSGLNQWVGGIAPLQNVSGYATTLQCCSYDVLFESENRGIAKIHGGQIALGGEVLSNGLQIAFDYIANVDKVIRGDGSVEYDVSIRRFACTGLSNHAVAPKFFKNAPAQAFQAPNVAVDEPISLPSGNAYPEQTGAQLQSLLPAPQVQAGQYAVSSGQYPVPPPQQYAVPKGQYAVPPVQQPVAPPAQYYSAPAAPAYYYPSTGIVQGGFCFSNDMEVELVDGSKKRMDQLEKKDWILSLGEKGAEYVPVNFWLHRVPEQEMEFNQFETEDGKIVKLTDKHYIYKGDCSQMDDIVPVNSVSRDAVYAETVKEGDCLYSVDKIGNVKETRVVKASKVVQTGIYAPMTTNGRLFINGIYASCHTIVESHSIQNTYFGYVDSLYQMYTSLFGVSSGSIVETPSGLSTVLDMLSIIIPADMISM